MQDFIRRQQMVTADAFGACDCSPRFGGPGMVTVIDRGTIAYPEFRGEWRICEPWEHRGEFTYWVVVSRFCGEHGRLACERDSRASPAQRPPHWRGRSASGSWNIG